jgi:exodeoxyribonuclease V beta subunit
LPDRYKLKGMMHGFIDLIFEHNGRYYVADYKSTHLGSDLANYQSEFLRESIYHHHYDLQYSLYALALHRYLRGRVPDYHPNKHFGGVYYFYLRGMKRGQSTGVFYESFNEAELQALDDVFLNAEGAKHA